VSQVIVTNDNLNSKRSKTREQELRINVDPVRKDQRLWDITKHDASFRKVFLLALSPLIAFWSLIMIPAGVVTWLFSHAMRLLGIVTPRQ
jgi:hypothetical protein